MGWFRWDGRDLILSVYVQPGASRAGIVGLHGDALKVRVTAQPERGRANQAVARLLARRLDVGPGRIAVQRGAASRHKLLRVTSVSRSGRLRELLERIGAGEKGR